MHQDDLTVVVFKENRASRTFLIPLQWFSRLGALLGALTLIALISTGLAVRNYVLFKNARLDFQREIEEEKQAILRAQQAQIQANVVQPGPDATAGPEPQTQPVAPRGILTGPLFGAFAPDAVSVPEDPAFKSPIELKNGQVSLNGKTLNVRFELHYVKTDGGNQQGRIFVLARGPEALLAHPRGSLEVPGSPGLLAFKRGEHFSVSRLRMVEAKFDVNSRDQIKSVEAIIVSAEGKVLIHEALPIK